MTDVICPNCHSVTPPFQYCLACNAFLGDMLTNLFENTSDGAARSINGRTARKSCSLSNLPALVRSAWAGLLTSSASGKPASVQMDAHLRKVCRRVQNQGICKLPTSSTREEEVAVIAKVTDLAKFKKQVKSLTTAIKGTGDDLTTIVTARLNSDESAIENLRRQPFVKSLKAARRVRPLLEQAMQETLAREDLLPTDNETNGGSGIIIGIVDFGLDIMHRNFRHADGSTRILALWDQKAPANEKHSPKPFGYGRLFKEDEINRALRTVEPYQAIGYKALKDSLMDAGAHGTYVTDVAAGNGLGSNCKGVAPQADIVFVDVSTAGTPIQGSQAVGSTFGDSVQLLEAVQFIFDYAKAKDRPCVINISLGTNGGPHDGTTLLEEAIDRLVIQEPNRAVVIAAGNSFDKKLHATGQVMNRGNLDLKWRIPRFDATSNELEIWYAREDRFTVEVFNPDGKRVARVKPGDTWEKVKGDKGLMTVVNRLNDPNNGDNTINIFFERGLSYGIWTLRLHGDCVQDGRFHAWIERDERGQSRFVKPQDKSYMVSNQCTLSSIACGHETIVVSAYNAYESDLPLSESSSSGPTRDNRKQQQPTISAPGKDVIAAQSGTLVLRHRQSGTSIAAAVVTGTIALMLAEAQALGMALTAKQIREILIRTAFRNPSGSRHWDPGFGFGRVCAKAAVAEVSRNLNEEPDKLQQQIQEAGSAQELAYTVTE
jgi:subtilisin family serine protease